jgi:hypothetical protein
VARVFVFYWIEAVAGYGLGERLLIEKREEV